MLTIARVREGRFHRTLAATLSLFLLTTASGLAQSTAKKPVKPETKKEPEIKEELTLKNDDKLTGQLLNSTGTEIKFKTDLAGEVTVKWENVKELKSKRDFAVVPKDVKDARDSAKVPQGAIKIGEKGIVVSPISTPKPEISAAPPEPEAKPGAAKEAAAAAKEIPASKIASVVDDVTYQKEINRKIGFRSGWDGHITTGTSMIFSTQNTSLYQVDTKLKRSIPTVSWLEPKLRTTIDFTLSAGKTTQPGTETTITNIFHVGGERDEYFSPRGYYLQVFSLDHNYAQGLVLQQKYGGGIGATLFKNKERELDITADLHYESQQFQANPSVDVEALELHLIASTLTEEYTRKWGKLQFDEKILADIAWNNASAFSASGHSSLRLPIYKKLAFSVSTIDNFLNNPQIGYKKNSFQFITGFALNLTQSQSAVPVR
ncbi:MAG: DUF481 domain-containing protein, partial [Candidatus Sulfotelmatobacter sp.]